MKEPRIYRHPEQPASDHAPLWRWRFAPHTLEARRAGWGEGRNDWQYVDKMPKHDSYVGIHPDCEAQQVTAAMVREALDDAHLRGELDEADRLRLDALKRRARQRKILPQGTAGLLHRAQRNARRRSA